MARKTAPLSKPAAEVLPYLRAALDALTQQQRADGTYYMQEYAAPYLLEQLARHGLTIVSTLPTAPASKPTTRPAALVVDAGAGEAEPRIIQYTPAESNKLLKAALTKAWPETKFFVRTDKYGNTDVYYRYRAGAPSVQEVREVVGQFSGQESNAFDGRDTICHNRIGADGVPEKVFYDTGMVGTNAVVTTGELSYRTDGLTHIKNVYVLALRKALLNA